MLKILKVFYKFVLRKKFTFIVFIFTVILGASLHSIQPYFYKLFVEEVPKNNYSSILQILILFVAIKFSGLIANIISYFLGDAVMIETAKDARIAVFKQVQDLDFAFHSQKSTGSLISAFKRGDGAFYTLFQALHHRILEITVGFCIMLYFLSRLDIRIGVFVFVSLAISLVISKFVLRHNIKTRTVFNQEEDKISAIITDNMMNYESVKLFAKEKWEQKRLETSFKPWTKSFWDYANSFRILDISMGSLINISIFTIIFIYLNMYSKTQIKISDFILVLGFINAFYPSIFDLIFGFRDIAKTYADIKIYFGILDYKIQVKDPEVETKLGAIKGQVEFKKVGFSYKEGRGQAVKNINLKIRPGQSVALVGKSGVGKTTLIRLLMRFYDVDDGAITIDGVDIRKLNKDHLRSYMGVVPQEPILFNNTIGYNIAYGKENATKQEIVSAAKMANIDEFIEALPKKYDTQVGERGIKLSGGQKQRLAIARMILSNPSIVIFDEATSHLDSESESLIQDAFWKAVKNKTTIIIAHRLSTIMKAEKIIVMKNGQIVEAGTHSDLIHEKGSLYRHFWDLQSSQQN